jgi:hypothetical protein
MSQAKQYQRLVRAIRNANRQRIYAGVILVFNSPCDYRIFEPNERKPLKKAPLEVGLFSVPTSVFVVPEQINVLTPSGTVSPDAGTRNPLLPTTREYLDAVYGASSTTGVPAYFAPLAGRPIRTGHS